MLATACSRARTVPFAGNKNGIADTKTAFYDMTMEFEWDPQKAASNQRKHDVSFQEAASVLGDPRTIRIILSRNTGLSPWGRRSLGRSSWLRTRTAETVFGSSAQEKQHGKKEDIMKKVNDKEIRQRNHKGCQQLLALCVAFRAGFSAHERK